MAASSQCTAALCIKVPQTWQGTKQLPITSPSLSSLETSGQARLSSSVPSTPALPSASLRWYLPVCFTGSNNIHSTQPFYLTHQIALPFKRSPSPNSTLQVKSCGSHLSPYLYQKTTLRWSKAVTSHEMWQETGKQPAKSVVTLAAPTKTPIRWSLKVSQYLCHLSSVSLACLSLNKWWIWPALFEFLWWSSVCTRLFFIYFFPVACWLL